MLHVARCKLRVASPWSVAVNPCQVKSTSQSRWLHLQSLAGSALPRAPMTPPSVAAWNKCNVAYEQLSNFCGTAQATTRWLTPLTHSEFVAFKRHIFFLPPSPPTLANSQQRCVWFDLMRALKLHFVLNERIYTSCALPWWTFWFGPCIDLISGAAL